MSTPIQAKVLREDLDALKREAARDDLAGVLVTARSALAAVVAALQDPVLRPKLVEVLKREAARATAEISTAIAAGQRKGSRARKARADAGEAPYGGGRPSTLPRSG